MSKETKYEPPTPSATDRFKAYLNSIINKIPENIHNELWNKLIDIIHEKEKTKIA
jgi:hypothetical protein